jgi:hypothetical protein
VTATVDDIVETLSKAYAEGATPGVAALLSCMGDACTVVHIPPAPGDGPLTKEFLTKGLHLEWKLFQTAVDGFTLTPEVGPENDGIRVTLKVEGLLEGEAIAFSGSMHLGVENGKVVSIDGGFGDTMDEVQRISASPKVAPLMGEMMQLATAMANGEARP